MITEDRAVLEQVIFRDVYVRGRYRRILFVGCSEFSSWYPALFADSGVVFETVDHDPAKARFGAPAHHFIGAFESLVEKPELCEAYDLVVLNGVFGYGIDSASQQYAALRTAYMIVRTGGCLLVGFREQPAGCDLDLTLVDVNLFTEVEIPGVRASRHRTRHANGHTFVCYAKREFVAVAQRSQTAIALN